MKDQASLNLLIVDSPIDGKALEGHLMLRATSDGLKLYDNTGVETPIGGEVDESRLLPTGGRNGNLLEYQEGVDRGNNVNTKLLLQPATSDGLVVDQAAGNAAPVGITNSGNVAIAANALVFSGENALIIEPATLGMTLGGNNEYSIEVDFQLDQVKSDWATLFGGDGSMTRSAFYINSSGATAVQGGIAPDTTGWTTGTRHRLTIERFQDGDSWKTVIYRNGAVLATSVTTPNTLSGDRFPIGSNLEGTGRNFVGKIWAFRISNKAEHRGVSFTPRELPFLPPAGQPVWAEGIDRSRLLPEDPANGDIPCYNTTSTTGGGNDENTKVLLHFDELPFTDTAAGNTSPAAVTNSGVTLDTDNFKFGTASAKFANSSNNLKVTVPQALMMSSPWLVDCWFKVDDGQWSDYCRIFTQDDEQTGGWTYYLMSGNRVGVWVRNVTPDEPTSAALTPNDWHYATLVYYNAKFYGFVDGVRFTVQDCSTEGFLNYIMLGKRIQSTSYSLRGNIDEFRLQLLDESEISKWIGATIPVPDAPYSKPKTVGEWVTINRSNFVEQTDHKLNPEPTTVDEAKYGFSPALKKDVETETFAYEMPSKANDVPVDSTLQLNNSGTPVFVEAEKVLLSDAKSTKLNQLDVVRQLPASPADNVTPVYKKQDVIGAMYNDSKVVVLLQGSKVNIAKNAAFQLTGGDGVTVDSDGNLVFNRGNGIIVPAGKFNNENNGQFTVDIMVAVDQLPSSTGSYEYILGNDNSPIYPFNYRVFGDGTVRFQYQNTSHHIQIEQGIFTLLSFDYDGTTLRSYKDGVLVGAQDMTYSAFPNTIGIGTDQYYSHTGFAGRIKYIRMSNIARYRGQAFTAPGLAGYVTPPDGEWVTMPAIGDNRLLPNNPTNGDIPVYTNDFDRSNFNTTDTVCLLQNAGVNQFENVAKGKIGGSRISNYAGSVTIDENGYFVYPGGSGTWIEFIDSGWNANGTGDWTLDVRMIAEATGSSQYFLGPANDGSGDPQAVIRGSGTTGTIRPYEISDMIHDITFGEEFTYSMAWEAATKTLRTWKDGKQMRKKTFSNNGYQFGFKGATEFWLGRNAVDPGLKGKVKYWRLSNAALYGDNEFTPPTDVYQDAPDGAWELVNKSELGGGGISEITVGAGLSGTGTTSDPINLNISNYTSQSTISLSSTEGSVNLAGYNSVNLQETFGNKLTLAERGIVITTASGADVLLNEHASNSPSGFVILDSTGKLPAVDGSQLTNLPTGAVDLSAYTGGINLNSTNDSAVAIKFNSGNPTYNAELSMSSSGVTLSGYGDVSLEHTGGSYLRLTSGEATLSSNASLALSAGSRLTISASEGIYLGAAGLNTAGGLVKVGDDGKIPSSLYDAGSGGGSEIDWSNVNAELISFSADRKMGFSSYGGIEISGGDLLINTSSINFGEAGGTVITFDLSTLDDLKIFHADTATTSTPNTAGGFAIVGLDGKLPASILPESSGGDTSALETRVTTLETTVGTLNTTVDEILADYGEGSGALVYRVVASATEPENPTEGMFWIKTE